MSQEQPETNEEHQFIAKGELVNVDGVGKRVSHDKLMPFVQELTAFWLIF